MTKIIFEFIGGSMHGRTLQSGVSEADVARSLWPKCGQGTVGNHFYLRNERSPRQDDLYEVVGKIGDEREVVVLAEFRPDPRD